MNRITSPTNETIKRVVKYVQSAKERATDTVTVLDGLHVCAEALTHGNGTVSDIFCTAKARAHGEMGAFLSGVDDRILTEVTPDVMQKIAPTKTPPGILGLYHYPTAQTPPTNLHFILLLDHIADPGNLGTMIRSAASMGVDGVFLSSGCADVWSPKVLRGAQGAHFYTQIFTQYDFSTIRKIFSGRIVGTFLDEAAASLYSTDLSGDIGIVMGNEGAGIDLESFAQYGDTKIYIPMAQGFESLNVAVATGMFLSEKRRQDLS